MTKEEKIKEAWLDVFDENKVKHILKNSHLKTGFVEFFILKNLGLSLGNDKLEKKFDGVIYNYRPKSLEGIEHNNGWIKIESENDLPTNPKGHYFGYWLKFNQKDIYTLDQLISYYRAEQLTHYQPITEPEPPLY